MEESQAIIILKDVKNNIGRNYKSKIRYAWQTGDYSSLSNWGVTLQNIRNQYGPSWLVKIRL